MQQSEAGRVRQNTSPQQNLKIDHQIQQNLRQYTGSNRTDIENRIKELDKEWDIERTLELNAATLAFTGTLLSVFVNKRWLIVPAVVTAFLVQHAIQGWCPPLPLFRKLGIRTRPEIDKEKYALKAMRGDFIETTNNPDKAWEAVQQ